MAELTNLTDRIAHLRERKRDSNIIQGAPPPSKPTRPSISGTGERRFAPDTFMLFVYGLLGVALVTQMILIFWLDLI